MRVGFHGDQLPLGLKGKPLQEAYCAYCGAESDLLFELFTFHLTDWPPWQRWLRRKIPGVEFICRSCAAYRQKTQEEDRA